MSGFLEVGMNEAHTEVIVNHPDLKPDANGVGHLVFSPAQAIRFAMLLLKKTQECDGVEVAEESAEAWLHTIHYEEGNGQDTRLSFQPANAYGEPGKDYSAEYRVVSEPLYLRRPGLPPLDQTMRNILGRPNFACIRLAHWLREKGHEILHKAEEEQAAVLHWQLDLYLQHGARWILVADEYLRPTPPQTWTEPPQ